MIAGALTATVRNCLPVAKVQQGQRLVTLTAPGLQEWQAAPMVASSTR